MFPTNISTCLFTRTHTYTDRHSQTDIPIPRYSHMHTPFTQIQTRLCAICMTSDKERVRKRNMQKISLYYKFYKPSTMKVISVACIIIKYDCTWNQSIYSNKSVQVIVNNYCCKLFACFIKHFIIVPIKSYLVNIKYLNLTSCISETFCWTLSNIILQINSSI